jgi:hypothetical protein
MKIHIALPLIVLMASFIGCSNSEKSGAVQGSDSSISDTAKIDTSSADSLNAVDSAVNGAGANGKGSAGSSQ